jgi:hypothetical protein
VGLGDSWPHLVRFRRLAASYPGLTVWLFGSALTTARPFDLDVLLVYKDRADVIALRGADWWMDFDPPLHIIAMTPDEEEQYQFIAVTGAERLSVHPGTLY